jgi:hypothetical protein
VSGVRGESDSNPSGCSAVNREKSVRVLNRIALVCSVSRRRVLCCCSRVLLALMILTVVGWGLSGRYWLDCSWGNEKMLFVTSGAVEFVWFSDHQPPISKKTPSVRISRGGPIWVIWNGLPRVSQHVLKSNERDPRQWTVTRTRIWLPLWFCFVSLAVPYALCRRACRCSKTVASTCPACGYDTRACAERCSECGLQFAGEKGLVVGRT